MASIESVTQQLSTLSISPAATVTHEAATNPTQWRQVLEADAAAPKSFRLLKTFVYKPKTAKTATPVPVVAIAAETTDFGPQNLGKKLNLKDLRNAADELITEFFGLDKHSLSPVALNKDNFSKLQVVVDSTIDNSSELFALRAHAPDATVFVTGQQIISYLKTLETDDSKFQILDFSTLKAEAAAAPAAAPTKKEEAKIEGAVQIAIGVRKEIDFATWYTSVLTKADMIDYYSVSGCYILKPWSYGIWEIIQEWFNSRIKELGVENAYFPMFVSSKVLEREKDHIEGFSPEVAWVTRAGQSELEEPIAIRPTSETAMYPYYAKWIKSHRDLPLKLNQWNSVVRWEFKNPQPFLRTREFLWQEGHTAHLTKAEADKEVLDILDLYRRVYEELLAVPVIQGVKSEKEKFAGGLYTTTVEGFIPTSGRGIQAATSHCLGQNFSRPEMFDIYVEDPNDENKSKLYVWQNSWGLSTRTIGVMVMTHGDNQGLVLPPRVASVQVVVVPCGITPKNRDDLNSECEKLAAALRQAGIRAKADTRDVYSPGWKFNHWEQKGVPLRLELGPADITKQQTIAARRDNSVKTPLALADITKSVPELLETIQAELFKRAQDAYFERIKAVTDWNEVVPALDNKCVVAMPWCEVEACEDDIKERSGKSSEPQDERAPSAGAKSLCIPFDQSRWPAIEPGKTKCTACGKDAKRWTLFGRSY